MTIKKVTGSKIYIGRRITYKDTTTISDYTGSVWTEIKGWTEAGDMAVETEVLTQLLISTGITQYGKGALSFPTLTNRFIPMPTDPGQVAMAAALLSCGPYEFKIEWGAACAEVATVAISAAGVVTWAAHGLVAGTPVTLTTTGALPTGLVAGTVYYVSATSLTASTFVLSATPGGSVIVATSAGSGVHTATAQPIGETDLFYGLVLVSGKTAGDANAPRGRSYSIQPICRTVEV